MDLKPMLFVLRKRLLVVIDVRRRDVAIILLLHNIDFDRFCVNPKIFDPLISSPLDKYLTEPSLKQIFLCLVFEGLHNS